MKRLSLIVFVAMATILILSGVYTTNASALTYYLTGNTYDGRHAATACYSGYHMANMYEIANPSSLIYVKGTSLPVGTVYTGNADQGYGPPVDVFGWVRTGTSSSSSENCEAYTSNNNDGTLARLEPPIRWAPQGSDPYSMLLWVTQQGDCHNNEHVWCVSNKIHIFFYLLKKERYPVL